jgi:hypothetical protein
MDVERLNNFNLLFTEQFESSFPNLVEVEVRVANVDDRVFEKLERISTFKGYKLVLSPFEVLSHLKNAKSVLFQNDEYRCSDQRSFPAFSNQENLRLPALRSLTLDFSSHELSYQDFLLFFTVCPNLETLSFKFSALIGFDESNFCQFIVDNKASLANLKKLELDIRGKTKGLTSKTVATLLSHTNIRRLENVLNIKITSKELDNWRNLEINKGMGLIYAARDPDPDSLDYWICCDAGKHTSSFSGAYWYDYESDYDSIEEDAEYESDEENNVNVYDEDN